MRRSEIDADLFVVVHLPRHLGKPARFTDHGLEVIQGGVAVLNELQQSALELECRSGSGCATRLAKFAPRSTSQARSFARAVAAMVILQALTRGRDSRTA